MDRTYFLWAQRVIGLGVVVVVLTAIFIPRGYRLMALLSLPVGAVVGTVCSFVGWALPLGSLMEDDVRMFLVASVAGLLTVIGWLVAVIMRSRSTTRTSPAPTTS